MKLKIDRIPFPGDLTCLDREQVRYLQGSHTIIDEGQAGSVSIVLGKVSLRIHLTVVTFGTGFDMEVECPLFEISDSDNLSIYLDVPDAEHRLEYNDIRQSNAVLVDSSGWILICIPPKGDHGALRIVGRSGKNISRELESCVFTYFNKHSEHFSEILGGSIPQNWSDLTDLFRKKRLWI